MHKNQFKLFSIGLLFIISSCGNYNSFRIVKNSKKTEQKHEIDPKKIGNVSSFVEKTELVPEDQMEKLTDVNNIDSMSSSNNNAYFRATGLIRSSNMSTKIKNVVDVKVSINSATSKNNVETSFSWAEYSYLIYGIALLISIVLIVVSAVSANILLLKVSLFLFFLVLIIYGLNLMYVRYA